MALFITLITAMIAIAASKPRSLRRSRPIDIPEGTEFRLPRYHADVIQTQTNDAPEKMDFRLGVNISIERQQGKDEGPAGEIISLNSTPHARSSNRSGKRGKSKKSGGKGAALDCSGPTTPFDSLVLVRFKGNPDDVSTSDVLFLELAFQETYNDLIASLCDEEDRIVVRASAITQEESKVIRNGGLSYSIKFAVNLACRGCDNCSATAFSPPKGCDPNNRRLPDASHIEISDLKMSECLKTHDVLKDEMLEKEKWEKNQRGKAGKVGTDGEKCGEKGGEGGMKEGKGGQKVGNGKGKGAGSKKGVGDDGIGGGGKTGGHGKKGGGDDDADTVCNCATSNPQFRPPTEREFQNALGASLRVNISRRRLQANEIAVVDVVELEELPCAGEISEFKTYVAVEFEGNAPSSADDIIALEQSFVETYNGLNDMQCDPFFRRVRTATIEQESSIQNSIQKYVVRYVVSGTCRGCEFGSNLFVSESERAKNDRLRQLSGQSRSSCSCPVFNAPNQPPTEEGFTFYYAKAVADLRDSGTVQEMASVLLVKELQEVECPGRLNDFTSVVVVDHMVVDSPVPQRELLELQRAFNTAYNRINTWNFDSCDVLFRSVKDVVVLLDGPSNLNRPLPNGKVRITYMVDGECRGCKSNTDLFDSPKSPARVADTGRALLTSDDQCFCPANYQVKSGPSSREFRKSFDAIIEELAAVGVVTTVEDPKKVMEVDEAECSVSVNSLTSIVFVDFIADTSLVTPAELTVVEEVFRDSYNDIIETFCDPISRNVLGARVSDENLPVSSTVSTVRFTFRIDGRCRGCEDGTRIFTSNGRVSNDVERHLAENNLCFCATGSPERRGATEGEFIALYDRRIRKLKDLGELQGIYSVENVIEDIRASTATPTFPSAPVFPIESGSPAKSLSPVAPASPVADSRPSLPSSSPSGSFAPVFPFGSAAPAAPVSPIAPVSPEAISTPSGSLASVFPIGTTAPTASESPAAPTSPVASVTPVVISPSSSPSLSPSGGSFPSRGPSLSSSSAMTFPPSLLPFSTDTPTESPTSTPTGFPSSFLTISPSGGSGTDPPSFVLGVSTDAPTTNPTDTPTGSPTSSPTISPSDGSGSDAPSLAIDGAPPAMGNPESTLLPSQPARSSLPSRASSSTLPS